MARNNPKSQRNFVINYLNHYKAITSMEAFRYYGITRLSSIIHVLRNSGYKIDTIMVRDRSRSGEPCRYAKYVIV